MTSASHKTPADTAEHLAIVTPVYNDWASLEILLRELEGQARFNHLALHVIVVDDASSLPCPYEASRTTFPGLASMRLLELPANMGHQGAIHAGLAAASKLTGVQRVVVMDADGEDRPEDVAKLVAASRDHSGSIVCAQRSQRSEQRLFILLYAVYKFLFRILTGKVIDFGNFILIPRSKLGNIIFNNNTRLHLAAALIRAKIPLLKIPTARGNRYAGKTNMNSLALILHGLRAYSIFADVISVRFIIAYGLYLALLSVAILSSVFSTDLHTMLLSHGFLFLVCFALTVLVFLLLLSITLFGIRTYELYNTTFTDRILDSLQPDPRGEAVHGASATTDST